MENNIYLDNASTTCPNKEVVDLYTKIETEFFGNSGSIHKLGINSLNLLNKARESVLESFKVKNYKVYFVGSSTEANNLAIKGYCHQYKNRGKHIITSNVEHASVKECFKTLEAEGFEVTYLNVQKDGTIKLEDLKKSINDQTILVSIMAVNNEIGSINPISEIAKIVHQYPKANLHVDTTQSVGKIDLDYNNIDMFVLSAHKIHGLKGSGALIAKNTLTFKPLISGGGQENGMRSGTVSVAHACALAKALKLELQEKNDFKKIHDYIFEKLSENNEIEINSPKSGCNHIINFSLKNKKASVVVEALSNKGIFVSSVSACNSKGEPASDVVRAIGKDEILSHNTIRVSLDQHNTLDDAKIFVNSLIEILRSIK